MATGRNSVREQQNFTSVKVRSKLFVDINQTGSGRVPFFEKGGTDEIFSSYLVNLNREFSNKTSIGKGQK